MSSIYFIRTKYKSKLGNWMDYFHERDTDQLTRKKTVSDIRNGQVANVVQVIEVDLDKGKATDVTNDIAREVLNSIHHHDTISKELHEFIEEYVGIIPASSLRVA